jgi:hypothetical protein
MMRASARFSSVSGALAAPNSATTPSTSAPAPIGT